MKYWCCAYCWEDNVEIDLQEVGWAGWFWLRVGTGQAAGTCECINKPEGFIKWGEFLDYLRAC
jgi:hypothetical protein